MKRKTRVAQKKEATSNRRIGSRLRAARAARGLTLWAVHEALRERISVPYLSDVERGNRSISAANLRDLVVLYELSDADAQALFQLRERLPPATHRRVLAAPEVWNLDINRLWEAVQRALAALPKGHRAAGLLREGLRTHDW